MIKKLLVIGSVSSLLALSACAIKPQIIDTRMIIEQAQMDRLSSQEQVEPITGSLTLQEAIARAIKYNLSWRIKLMEESLASHQLDLSQYDQLPKLMAVAGYHNRSEDYLTTAIDSVTGEPSLAHPFSSSAKEHVTADLGLTWNTLDFGVSYYNSKQKANHLLIALERRRKAMHILMQDVNSAYWRAASAQRLNKQIKEAKQLAEQALSQARLEEQERLRPAEESLRYQRQLLENLRLLEVINQELSIANVELVHLINAPMGTQLTIADFSFELPAHIFDIPMEQLELIAISKNADLKEKFYDSRNAHIEAKKTLLKLFPKININAELKNDNDDFLVYNSWNQVGSYISFNLFNLLTISDRNKLTKAGIKLSDQRRIATQMAVLVQVHIARLQYANSYKQFNRADQIWQIDAKLQQHVANKAQNQTQGELALIAQKTTTILSLLRRYQAFANAQAASGKLQSTLGLEPEIGSVQDLDLATLTKDVEHSIQAWKQAKILDDNSELLSTITTTKFKTPPEAKTILPVLPLTDQKKLFNDIEQWKNAWILGDRTKLSKDVERSIKAWHKAQQLDDKSSSLRTIPAKTSTMIQPIVSINQAIDIDGI